MKWPDVKAVDVFSLDFKAFEVFDSGFHKILIDKLLMNGLDSRH